MDTYEGKCKTKNSDSNKHIKHIYTYFEIERKKKIMYTLLYSCKYMFLLLVQLR